MTNTVMTPLRRVAGATAVAALALTAAGITPAFAAGPTGPSFGPFGMTPSPVNGAPRPYFNLSLAPGSVVRDSVVVTNLSRGDERLRMAVSKGVTATNSGSAYENLIGRCTGPSCWISGLPHTVLLGAKEQMAVGFTVRVPRNIKPGQYLAGVTVQAAKKPKPVRVGKHGHSSAQAIIIDEVTVGVAVTIGNPSKLITAVKFGQPSAEWVGRTPRLNLPVTNKGQTFAHGTGKITCVSGGRTHSYRVIMETVLPGGSAVLPVNARHLQPGSSTCRARLLTSTGHVVRWSGTVTLAAMTLTKTYHPAKGVYVSLPESMVPAWAIALMVLGGLILAVLVLLFVWRSHRGTRMLPAGRRRPRSGTLGAG